MTLLDEYQALPGEPTFGPVIAVDYDRMLYRLQLERRDAVIRLLCRALRESLLTMEEARVGMVVSEAEFIEGLRALLTAVERDFPEGG
jgi:hypothetical protein